MNILIINGPNMQLLGKREPDIYGLSTLDDLRESLLAYAEGIGVSLEFFQSNHEGDIVDQIAWAAENNMDGIIINPAAYTHTSIAIGDAVKAVSLPAVEVHISNIYAREQQRSKSLIAHACIGQICGFGFKSYELALNALVDYIKR